MFYFDIFPFKSIVDSFTLTYTVWPEQLERPRNNYNKKRGGRGRVRSAASKTSRRRCTWDNVQLTIFSVFFKSVSSIDFDLKSIRKRRERLQKKRRKKNNTHFFSFMQLLHNIGEWARNCSEAARGNRSTQTFPFIFDACISLSLSFLLPTDFVSIARQSDSSHCTNNRMGTIIGESVTALVTAVLR